MPRSQWPLSEANSVHSQSSPWRPIFLNARVITQTAKGPGLRCVLNADWSEFEPDQSQHRTKL